MQSEKEHVVVIGAGIIGLSCALSLLESNHDVSVVAKNVPGDHSIEYTSPWAGGHWRPHGKAGDQRQCQWDIETYEEWMKLVESEEASMSKHALHGLAAIPEETYWDDINHPDIGPDGAPALWYKDLVRDFRTLKATPRQSFTAQEPSTDQPGPETTAVAAARFLTIAINVPKHLAYLQDKIKEQGGVVIQHAIPIESDVTTASNTSLSMRLSQAADAATAARTNTKRPRTFVNATGLHGALFAGKPSDSAHGHAVRGQTVLVRGEAPQVRVWHGLEAASSSLPSSSSSSDTKPAQKTFTAYAIPRPGSGTTIFGGSYDATNDWSGAVDESLTRDILRRCRRLCPELLRAPTQSGGGRLEFDVLSVQVGLRPAREGGARVELERVPADSLRSGGEGEAAMVVVHAYGHAGAGFQNSIGVARDVVRLVGGGGLEQ